MIQFKQLIFILALKSLNVLGQETENREILSIDSTWQHEHFDFPLRFAPDINLEGFEDARFPVGWSNQDSLTFWSYVFAWEVASNKQLSMKKIQNYLTYYFSGLMNDKNTFTKLSKKKLYNNTFHYWGEISTTEAFFTKEKFILNVKIEQNYCSEKNVAILIFRFSPKKFDSDVWNFLSSATVKSNPCIK